MKIYSDPSRQTVVQNQLIENKVYYIDFEEMTANEIEQEITKSKLTNFLSWQFGNKYSTLTITNYIGNIYFCGHTFDVRSNKFLLDLAGAEQFQTILSDIQELSKNIIFSYSSPSFILRSTDFEDVHPSLLLIFNYFKNIILDWDSRANLQSVFDRIIKNPHACYEQVYRTEDITQAQDISAKTIKSLASNSQNLFQVDEEFEHLKELPLTIYLSERSTESYFPTRLVQKRKGLSYNTPENRFLKFFFEYIESVACMVGRIQNLPTKVKEDKDKILSFCRSTLKSEFFQNIGKMEVLPVNSSVLQSRAGYKDILTHYLMSRFGIKFYFEEFRKQSLLVDLKKISDLYEYWVFYKIARAFLGDNILIEQQEVYTVGDDVSYGTCFKNEHMSVCYNYTESRSRGTSYSVNMRPDVTIVVGRGQDAVRLIFDAKYKVSSSDGNNGQNYSVKSEDLHKMHTYRDAIENTLFAIVIYPGTKLSFYEKDTSESVRENVPSISNLDGIGAIPLIPHDENLNEQFLEFVQFVKSYLGIN